MGIVRSLLACHMPNFLRIWQFFTLSTFLHPSTSPGTGWQCVLCCSFTPAQTPRKGCTGGTWRHRCLQGHHEDGHRPGLPDGRSEGAEKKYAGAALQGGRPECEEGAACYFFEQVASNRPAHLAAPPQPHCAPAGSPGESREGRGISGEGRQLIRNAQQERPEACRGQLCG